MNEAFFTCDTKGLITFVNKRCCDFLGYSAKEIIGRHILDCVPEEEKEKIKAAYAERLISGKRSSYETKVAHRNGRMFYINLNSSPIIEKGKITGVMVLASDITERKQAEDRMNEQQIYFRQLFESSPEWIAILDSSDIIIDVNKGFERLFGYSANEISGLNINELLASGELKEEADSISSTVNSGEVVVKETVRRAKDGRMINVSILGYPIMKDRKELGVYGIYSDITNRKNAEDRLKYLSLHDTLTGLHNRTFFEQEMRFAGNEGTGIFAVVVCDVDGLKLINDTLGHDSGDLLLISAANVIRTVFESIGIISRIGGDEFAILIKTGNEAMVKDAVRQLRQYVNEYNIESAEFHLNISIGFAMNPDGIKPASDLFKEADNNMYREKLGHSQSARSAIVQTLIKTLEARDFLTEGHADRLQYLVAVLGAELGMSEQQIADLRLLAQFHDIGKVGIPDRILFKPGPLTYEEKMEMQRHSEIGYRIAQSAHDLIPIADWILKHHEWWNGEGYPLSLEGNEIPIEARVIAIADAYDAMTNDRPYRKAMDSREAVRILKRNAGIQFDPELVTMFVKLINDKL